jgi:hypothetical protein
MKSIPWWVWFIPIVVLMVATMRLPYGYYTFVRLVVCASAAFLAFTSWNERPVGQVFAIALALLAVLFNPLIPIYLKREVWFYLDWLAASVFALHLVVMRLEFLSRPSR